MRLKFIALLLCGLILGVVGAIIVVRATPQETQARPTIPPNATPREFNGEEYYIVPLSNYASNKFCQRTDRTVAPVVGRKIPFHALAHLITLHSRSPNTTPNYHDDPTNSDLAGRRAGEFSVPETSSGNVRVVLASHATWK
jgi:hypothetical protein